MEGLLSDQFRTNLVEVLALAPQKNISRYLQAQANQGITERSSIVQRLLHDGKSLPVFLTYLDQIFDDFESPNLDELSVEKLSDVSSVAMDVMKILAFEASKISDSVFEKTIQAVKSLSRYGNELATSLTQYVEDIEHRVKIQLGKES